MKVVCNGNPEANLLPGKTLLAPNERYGRDIAMHAHALKWIEKDETPEWGWFFNDDIVCIDTTQWFEIAQNIFKLNHWINTIGTQPNLKFMLGRHKTKSFVRTSAFAMRIVHFKQLWKKCAGNAQRFEKGTLTGNRAGVMWFDNPTLIMDSNTYLYRKEIRKRLREGKMWPK
jgi:hypothetical protein